MILPDREYFEKKVSVIHKRLEGFKDKKILVSSSFQGHSIPLLHILSSSGLDFEVAFVDTGFHFPETVNFVQEMQARLSLKVFRLESLLNKLSQRDRAGRFLYATDPDRCCKANKVAPLNDALRLYDVWISGARSDQTELRASMDELEYQSDLIKYRPLISWGSKDIHYYRKIYDLPGHPLEQKGFFSIGCEPCTAPAVGAERSGRWAGLEKTECGLMNL